MLKEYIVESWYPGDPDNRDRSTCDTWQEADALALSLARDGYDALILRVENSYAAEVVDQAEMNGVRPGIDFPATLFPGGRLVA